MARKTYTRQTKVVEVKQPNEVVVEQVAKKPRNTKKPTIEITSVEDSNFDVLSTEIELLSDALAKSEKKLRSQSNELSVSKLENSYLIQDRNELIATTNKQSTLNTILITVNVILVASLVYYCYIV